MRRLHLFFLLVIFSSLRSQTLYWVGGSGNFNDANHWSLSSGGAASGQVPNSNSSAIFDNNSGNNLISVTIPDQSSLQNLSINTQKSIFFSKASNNARLIIKNAFNNLLDNYAFTSDVVFEFNNNNNLTPGYISPGKVASDFIISGGNWNIGMIRTDKNHSLFINNSSVNFTGSYVEAGNLIVNTSPQLNFNNAVLKVSKQINIVNVASQNVSNTYLNDNLVVGNNIPITPVINNNNLLLPCITTSSVGPTCSPGCDGKIIFTLPNPACFLPVVWPMPYQLNPPAIPGCPLVIPTLTFNPGTYTINNVCACLTVYNLQFFPNDFSANEVVSYPFAQPSISSFAPPAQQKSVTCNGACNGSVNVTFFGTPGPYNFTISPPGGPITFSTSPGNLQATNLCGGTLTLTVVDQSNQCTTTYTQNINQPPAINPQVAITQIACFGSCTGSAVITPTGGVAGGYTVTFNPGITTTVALGGSVASNTFCAGSSVSATVTNGANNCTVAVGPITFTSPPAVTVTPTQTNVACAGGSNGSASVSVTGGVAPYGYTWTPGPNTGTNSIGGLPAGTQTVTISNNGGQCTRTQTFNITGPNNFTIAQIVNQISCAGGCNGSASISITAGSGNGAPYGFTWSPVPGAGQGTGTISSLCPGSYTATISDNSPLPGCFTTAVVTITAPAAYTVSAVIQTITCFGQCTGAATVSIAGGTPGYTINWVPAPGAGQGTKTITSLCSNTYVATITDAAGCVTVISVPVPQPPTLVANFSSTSVTCNGGCNGSINSAPSGGLGAPYSFSLITTAPSTIVAAPPFNNLCAGNYTLVIGSGGCTQSFPIVITQPASPLSVSIATTAISCFTMCNGSLSGNVLGGTPGYTLVWTTPTGTLAGNAIAGQCAGNYTVLVTDANGCTVTATSTLTQPSQITATLTPTFPTCNGFCNGVISAAILGGVPGYTLVWSAGVGNPNINRCAGLYTLNVTDANNCPGTFTINLTQPAAIVVSQTVSGSACAGGCNGSATINAVGGTPTLTYALSIPPVASNTVGIFNGLCSGAHSGTVTDGNGCPQPFVVNIINAPVLSIAVTSLQSSCNACTGAATVAPAGGTLPYVSIVWTNSLAVVVGAGVSLSNLCPGPYTVTVTDNAGCTATVGLTILQTVNVSVNVVGSGIQCFGSCTGSAAATATGGTLPYTYSWTPTGQTVQTAVGLCPGVTYTVLVKDAFLCSNTATISFVNPPAIIVNTTQVNAGCFGSCNGVITTTASGGTGTLSYLWSPGAQTTSSISGQCVGGRTLTVTDQNNCSQTLTFNITQTPSITATFTATSPTGCGINNGSICVTASGGNGPVYTYTWFPVAGSLSCLSGLGAGAYSVIIADNGSICTTTIATAISNPPGPTLTINTKTVSCFGGNNGGATVTAAGVPAFGFTWSPVVPNVTGPPNVNIASSMISGTYNISVSDGNGCITSQTVGITQPSAMTITPTQTNVACATGSTGVASVSVSGSIGPYNYVWNPGPGGNTATIGGLPAGNQTVTISSNGGLCSNTQTFNIGSSPALTLTTTSTNVKCFGAANGSIVANASGGTAPISYSWSPGGAITPTITNLGPGSYTIVVTDFNGCSTSSVVTISQPLSPLTSTLNFLNPTCSFSTNGSATITGAGGTAPYTFTWSGSPVTTSTINGLGAGSYTATITDFSLCTSSQAFTITAPGPFTATLNISNPTCNNYCNGTVTSVLSGAQGTVNYVWAPAPPVGQGTGTISGLCAIAPGPNYNLTATDAQGCQLSIVATLTNPPAILANISTTNPSCNGNCNGFATSNPANVVGAPQYSWSAPTQTTQTANGLCGGIGYSLSILDANSCTAAATFTLINPPAFTINPAVVPATCGFSNAVITIGVAGGTPTYNFAWGAPIPPINTTSVAGGLGAGVYSVTVFDINGCTNTLSIPISNSNGPNTAPIVSTSVSCFGGNNGSANINAITIAGGTPSYAISWLAPPAPSTVNPQVSLMAGTYTAQITDLNGCILFTAVAIAGPSSITINPTFGVPTCPGINNGSITLNTSGGTGPGTYNYTWTPQGPNNSQTLLGAGAGTFVINILDANNCPSSQTVVLPAAINMAATPSVTSNQCFGNCLGSATLGIVQFGNAPLSFAWSNGGVTNSVNGLCNGTYTVTVTDNLGCFNSFTAGIVSPSQITATTGITAPGCNICNGSATIAAGGGVPGYTYNWSNGPATTTVGNLCAGLYQVLVTDVNSCTLTQNVAVSSATGITGETFTNQNVSCAGLCNGSSTVTPIGGTAPITFSWIAPPSITSSVGGLCPGVYFVQMTDFNGCIRTSSTTINAAPGITLSPFITQPSCGNPNGIINVVPSGGAGPPYTFSWSPGGQLTSSITGQNAGIYTVAVTAGGCTKVQQITLSNSNAPVITFTQTNVACFNGTTGAITALGTSTAAPITYSWSTGSTLQTVSNLTPGIVSLTVSAGGCNSFQTFTLTDNPAMQLSISNIKQLKCFGDCNGAITLIPSGGVLPYTFTWSAPGGTPNPLASLCAGTYTGTITDFKGCPISTVVTIFSVSAIAETNTVINSSCSTALDGAASITIMGGTPAPGYTVNWTGPSSFTANTQNIVGVKAGTYKFVITDKNLCSKIDSVKIVPTVTIIANAGRDTAFCTNNSVVLNGTKSTGAIAFNWFLSPIPSPTLATTPTVIVTPPVAGSFTYVLQAIANPTCVDFATVVVNAMPLPLVDAGTSTAIPIYSSVTIGGNPTAIGNAPFTYSWTPSLDIDNFTVANPLASNTVDITYTVLVTDVNGCTASDTIRISLYPEIKIPNGFSPNGDSKNDKWEIDNIQQFTDCTVEVYNRWGELLFNSTGYKVLFDGIYKGKDLPVGTYYYVINLNHPAYPKPYTGPLTIFR